MLEEKPISFNNRVSNVVPSCVMWNIWRERNRRMFKGHEFSVERIESGFASSLSWISLDDCRFSKV